MSAMWGQLLQLKTSAYAASPRGQISCVIEGHDSLCLLYSAGSPHHHQLFTL